jgi:hypothetical protein
VRAARAYFKPAGALLDAMKAGLRHLSEPAHQA